MTIVRSFESNSVILFWRHQIDRQMSFQADQNGKVSYSFWVAAMAPTVNRSSSGSRAINSLHTFAASCAKENVTAESSDYFGWHTSIPQGNFLWW